MAKGEIIIGVSKLSPNYAAWLNNLMDGPEIIDLYGLSEEAIAGQFQRFSGLLLPGGSDIHPGLYNRPEDIHHCRDIDTKRDGLESYLIKMALEERMPVLGICRACKY
jgi:putative glutamine amidotransferase